MKFLIILFLMTTVHASTETLHSDSIKSQKDLDGLYYVISESKNYKFSALVLSHDGKSIPQKSNDSNASTKPGFYPDNIRYKLAFVHFNKGQIQFETKSVNNVKFRFKGEVKMKADPDFDPDLPLRSIDGTLEKLVNDKRIQIENITFGEAVVY